MHGDARLFRAPLAVVQAALALALASTMLPACVAGLSASSAQLGGDAGGGSDGTGGSSSSKGGTAPGHIPPASACTTPGTPAPRALRRLTNREVNATLLDLFGNDSGAPQSNTLFVPDPTPYTFDNQQDQLQVSPAAAIVLRSLSEAAATLAAAKPALVGSCTTTDAACQATLIGSFGLKAWRRPPTPAEITTYQALMAQGTDFSTQVQILVSTMLQSPYFIYRSELGGAAAQGVYTLTPYEVATEMSYMLIGSTPDAALLDSAAKGELATPAQRTAQAQRLLMDPRARSVVGQFFAEWLNVSLLNNNAPMQGTTMLSAQNRADMVTEVADDVGHLVFDTQGTYADLYAIDQTYVNSELAAFYGISGGGTGSAFAAAPIGSRDKGILGLGGVLAANGQLTYGSPTLRGRMVRMRLLCDSLGSPPPGVPALPDTGAASATLRQRFTGHVSNASCSSCHTLMDPLGFTMGAYNAVGMPWPNGQENGQAVDTSGSLVDAASGAATPLTGLSDLSQKLAASSQAQACMLRHMAIYELGALSWSQDACTFAASTQVAAGANFNLLQSYLAIMQTPSFTQRTMDP